MMNSFETVQDQAKENMELATKSFEAVSKGMQEIGKETAEYTKASFDKSQAAMQKIASSKSMETAMEAQTEFVKSSYEAFVAQATKMGELYVDVAKEAYKPFEKMMPTSSK